jgi:hypothetical protein
LDGDEGIALADVEARAGGVGFVAEARDFGRVRALVGERLL